MNVPESMMGRPPSTHSTLTREPQSEAGLAKIAAFITIAFTWSWLQRFAVIASQRGWISGSFSLTPLAIFGPTIASLLVATGEERKKWFKALFRWRVPLPLFLVACLTMPAVFAICTWLVGRVEGAAFEFPPFSTIAAVAFGMFVTAGVGEEPGWRGFLLIQLRMYLSPLVASLIVAVVWFIWHLPLFWIEGATQRDIPVLAFVLGLVAYTVILTWLAEGSSNSTLVCMLFHASANATFWLAMVTIMQTPSRLAFRAAYVSLTCILGATAAVLLSRGGARRTPKLAG
jgi:uncharacterized protein